jgi:UDP-galactopyranose mutase
MEPGDVPYYPLRLNNDKALLQDYVRMAEQEEKVTFCGRLGTYRYLDMHQVIGESLDLVKTCLATDPSVQRWPSFSVRPI